MDEPRNLKCVLEVDGVDPEIWRVEGFSWKEAISAPGRAMVALTAHGFLDEQALLGAKARLTIRQGEGRRDRVFDAVVMAADIEYAALPESCIVNVELASRLGLAHLGRCSRVFRDTTVQKVVEDVLAEVGISAEELTWVLDKDPGTREIVTQRDESDGVFLERLLADEGISFVVRQGPDRPEGEEPPGVRIVFFDGVGGYVPVLDNDVLPDRRVVSAREDSVSELQTERRVAPDTLMLRDYDFIRPGFDLTVDADSGGPGLPLYDHPGCFDDMAAGRLRAERQLGRARQDVHQVEASSDCPLLEPGRTFSLMGHLRGDVDADFVVTEITHEGFFGLGDQATSYGNRFRGMPATAAHRPLAPAQAEPPGLQAAFVTGPSGAELHSDEWGRVRVSFPWDRSGVVDQRSSQALRVGQLPLGGSMVVPRVGFEVLVDHEMGELERPVVVGHLYNAKSPPPYELPGGSTRSSMQTATLSGGAGANEMRVDDAAGAEEMYFNASHDLVWSVEHDAQVRVVSDQVVTIGTDHELKITANEQQDVMTDRRTTVGAQQSLTVTGDASDSVGASSALTVGSMRTVTVKGDLTELVDKKLERTVGALQGILAIASFTRVIKKDSRTMVGGAWAEAALGARSVNVDKDYVEVVGGLKVIKAKSHAVKAGTAYVMNAASETIRCGADRTDKSGGALALSAGGGLSVQAKNINIVGEKKVVLRVGGSTIELTPTAVKLKSSKVKLKGAKALASPASHKTG